MTRDEILVITAGREMDALVAEKVMGYKITDIGRRNTWSYVGDDGITYLLVQGLPEFSTDIAAAWDVFCKFFYPGIWRDGELWACKLRLNIDDNPVIEYAPTVTLAICRAALLATMKEG